MNIYIKHLLLLMILADCIVLLISILLILKIIPRNKFFGFRSPKTLSNADIWGKANAVVGKGIFATTLLCLFGLILLFVLRKSIPVFLIYFFSSLICLVPYMVLLILTVFKVKENK